MAQSMKCLPCKHENTSLIPRTQVKKKKKKETNVVIHACIQPARLVYLANSIQVRDLSLEKKKGGGVRLCLGTPEFSL